MNLNFSQRVKDILGYSKEEAIRLGNNHISPEHLFLGIIRDGECNAIEILLDRGVNLKQLKESIEKSIRVEKPIPINDYDVLPLLKSTERILKLVYLEAKAKKSDTIESEHLLFAILREDNTLVTRLLREVNIDYSNIQTTTLHTSQPTSDTAYTTGNDDDDDDGQTFTPQNRKGAQQHQQSNKPSSDTPVLDNFGIDLTKAAEEGKLDPVVGRGKEIERLAQILSRRKKNNPVLIGEPGVGKSAIVEGLALRITQKQVSRLLFNKRVIALDLASIVAGTKYRGQFEERMKAILNELAKNDDIILFIDEIHTLVGAGGASGSLDAANMLKPSLARGEIQCIGATTLDEYRQYIEKDGALERRFQKIMVEPTSIDETIEILNNIKGRYEEHHNVTYTDDAIDACVKLTNRFISDRLLPDKAIDALDESGSRVHISNIVVPEKIILLEKKLEEIKLDKMQSVKNQDFEKAANFRDREKEILNQIELEKKRWEKDLNLHREIVDAEKVAEVVAMMTGVPVQRIAQAESHKLLSMGEELKKKIIGQDEAIEKIVKSIRRNRAGLKDPNKPIGTFIFLGPTGVGKTQLAKVLAQQLFDSSENLVKIDMSEYMEKFTVSRLVGAPPGYVGYEEGGQLTEKVRRHPYSVVLLDEIEKAHPDVFHILLQLLDEGQLTDSLGRKVDFRNTIVILTSNVGTKQLIDFGQGIGFDTQSKREGRDDSNSATLQKALQKTFAPEFLNRIDDVIMFRTLGKADINKIIDIELREVFNRIESLGLHITLSSAARNFLAEKGLDERYGARPLKRAIQKYLEDDVAEAIIKVGATEGNNIFIGYSKGKDKLKITIK